MADETAIPYNAEIDPVYDGLYKLAFDETHRARRRFDACEIFSTGKTRPAFFVASEFIDAAEANGWLDAEGAITQAGYDQLGWYADNGYRTPLDP